MLIHDYASLTNTSHGWYFAIRNAQSWNQAGRSIIIHIFNALIFKKIWVF